MENFQLVWQEIQKFQKKPRVFSKNHQKHYQKIITKSSKLKIFNFFGRKSRKFKKLEFFSKNHQKHYQKIIPKSSKLKIFNFFGRKSRKFKKLEFFSKKSKTLSKNYHPVTVPEVLQESPKVTKLNEFLMFVKKFKKLKKPQFFQNIFNKSSKKLQKMFKNLQKIFKKSSPPNPVITWFFCLFQKFFSCKFEMF